MDTRSAIKSAPPKCLILADSVICSNVVVALFIMLSQRVTFSLKLAVKYCAIGRPLTSAKTMLWCGNILCCADGAPGLQFATHPHMHFWIKDDIDRSIMACVEEETTDRSLQRRK